MTQPLISTLADIPFHVSGKFPKPVLIRHCQADRFVELSSREFFERVRDFALGLQTLGVSRGERVGLLCETRPEWVMADLAVQTLGAITVPIYPTLPPRQIQFILVNAGARVVIASTKDQVEKLREVRSELPDVGDVVVIDSDPSGGQAVEAEFAFSEIVERGHQRLMQEDGLAREYKEAAAKIVPDDVATIIYTSGTTGDPKGVVLTHAAIVSNIVGADTLAKIHDGDEALSFLPLCHALERTVVYLYLYKGVTIAFGESLDTVRRDLVTVRPTIMTGVPRVFDKLHTRILEGVEQAPAFRRALFYWALGVGKARSRAELAGRTPGAWTRLQNILADRVMAKVRERVGGRLRFVVSGGAALSRTVAEFLFAVGLPVLEGYGLTETAPVLTVNPEVAPRLGTVGKALPGVQLRIAEDGEILAKGPNLMRGYYNNPEATAAVMTDGWFHTGDIGRLDEDGYLAITDRKKELIVTSGGKNIAPQPIEQRLKADPLVAEAVVVGDGRPYVAVLLVPDGPILMAKVGSSGGSQELAALVLRDDVKALFDAVIQRVNAGLPGFEQLKRFALLPTEFSVNTGELTPTLKVKRRIVTERWGSEIEALYS